MIITSGKKICTNLWDFFGSELTAFKSLSKLPTSRDDVVAGDGAAVAGGYSERKALAV